MVFHRGLKENYAFLIKKKNTGRVEKTLSFIIFGGLFVFFLTLCMSFLPFNNIDIQSVDFKINESQVTSWDK